MDKKVLITGVTGFLGGHLTSRLISQGYDVVALSRNRRSTPLLEKVFDRIHWHGFEHGSLQDIFEKHRIDAVIHIAASYGRAGESPCDLVEANLCQSLRLLSAAQAAGVKKFINTGTNLPSQTSAYALSKQQFSDWCQLLSEESDTHIVNVRLEHMYGPLDSESKFATWLIRQMLGETAELPLTKGEQCRDFIYIDDVISAYETLLQHSFSDRHVDIEVGSGETVTIKAFVEQLKSLCGGETALKFGAVPYREHEAMNAQANIADIQALGWRCETSLKEGLRKTVEAEKRWRNI